MNSHVYRDMLMVAYVRTCHVYLHIPTIGLLTVTYMETRPMRLLLVAGAAPTRACQSLTHSCACCSSRGPVPSLCQ